MIRGVWLSERRETSTCCPVKLATVNDDTTDRGTMATNELGGGVDDDICAVLERLNQVWCRERIIEYKWNAILMCDIGYGTNVQRVKARIADGFREDGLCAIIDSTAEVLWIAAIHKLHLDPQFGQRIVEQVIGSTVQARR